MLKTDSPQIQPHDLEVERAVLGAILLDSTALARAQECVSPDDFYDDRHRRIFMGICDVAGQSEPVDLLTVGHVLEGKGDLAQIGGRAILAELVNDVASASNVIHHAQIVREHAKRRRLIALLYEGMQRAYRKDPIDQLMGDTERALFQIMSGQNKQGWCSLAKIARDTAEYVDRIHKQSSTLIGIPTGYTALDSLLSGWQRSDLIIVGARPSMGKTAFALGSALAAARAGYRVGFLSLEMSSLQLGLRLHGMGAPIDVHALKAGSLSPEGWRLFAATGQQFESLPFWVDDSSMVTVEQVAAKARHLRATNGLDLLMVDYLQLLQLADAENRQQGIAEASRKLKLLAKDLEVPVLVLSQVSRTREQRKDKRPGLADLRDSGAIEQDADVVLFIYREEVYDPETDEKGTAEVLVRKHRNGPVGDRQLRFVDRFARFEDLEAPALF
jgi:replicative DNA helicase